MKKNVITAIICVGIYAVSFALTGVVMSGIETPQVHEAAVVSGEPVSRPEYTVSEYRGVVAVFAGGEASPVLETDIPVSGLRESDRAMVRKGIAAETYNEVLYLLEDFNS